jgi:lysophospholipase L1-like esterase
VASRLVQQAVPALRHIRAQVALYALAWDRSNLAALAPGAASAGPLWVVLGDSTAQGIGASAFDKGYVGQLQSILEERSGKTWRVLNLSKSGARAADVLAVQLPRLEALGALPDLVTCAVGTNDIVHRTSLDRVERELREIASRLPAGSVVATLPPLSTERVATLNEIVRSAAAEAGLVVADVNAHTGPPWTGKLAADHFHPADLGYADWAAAFAEVV